jgi:hypothetical protein
MSPKVVLEEVVPLIGICRTSGCKGVVVVVVVLVVVVAVVAVISGKKKKGQISRCSNTSDL